MVLMMTAKTLFEANGYFHYTLWKLCIISVDLHWEKEMLVCLDSGNLSQFVGLLSCLGT